MRTLFSFHKFYDAFDFDSKSNANIHTFFDRAVKF